MHRFTDLVRGRARKFGGCDIRHRIRGHTRQKIIENLGSAEPQRAGLRP